MVLDLALKATALLIVGFVCGAGLRQASAATRHALWSTVFVALLLLPFARLVMPEWPVVPVPDLGALGASAVSSGVPGVAGSLTARSVSAGVASADSWMSGWSAAGVLQAIWVVGGVLQLIWIASGVVGTRRLGRQARSMDDERVVGRARLVADWLGVRRPIRLLAVSNDAMPMTWGVMSPTVLLPDVARGWSDAGLDAVLTHEFSHIERFDVVWHAVARVATAVWWWHPLMWVAARRVRLERERACDDLVLAKGAGASDYAANLLTCVTALRSPVATTETLAMARRSQLEGRVMAILASGVNRRGVSQAGVMAAMLVMVLVWPLAAARPVRVQAPQQPLRVGGNIQPPAKIKDVTPEYPEAARAEGRQGVAIIELLVGTEGTVTESKVIRSIGEDLDRAAVDAVSQWEFSPTLFNGAPVPVIMTVTVNFRLDAMGQPEMMPPPPPPGTAALPPDPPASPALPTGPPSGADVPPASPPPPTEPPAGLAGAPAVSPPAAPPAPPAPPAGGGEVTPPPVPPNAPPPSPPAAGVPDGSPLRIGGPIEPPEKTKNVLPVYPPEAKEAKIQGVVVLEIQVDSAGLVTDAKVIRGVDGLDDAARDAVLQWEFHPTLVNGRPVAIIMTVTVNFTLKNPDGNQQATGRN